MHTTMRSLALGLALLIGGTSAQVSLSSFTPRVDIQNSVQCRAAYTTTIKGCQASDFSPPNRCSSACVQGLQGIGELIKTACKGVDVGETSIIGVFQFGIGIASLCPGVDVVTASPSVTTTARTTAAGTTTTRATTSSVPPPAWSLASSSISLTTSTFTSTLARSSDAAQTTTSQGGLQVDPNPTSVAGAPAQPPATSAAAPPKAQAQNGVSGGGSPFDVVSFGASPRLQALDSTLAALVGIALFFLSCA